MRSSGGGGGSGGGGSGAARAGDGAGAGHVVLVDAVGRLLAVAAVGVFNQRIVKELWYWWKENSPSDDGEGTGTMNV